MRISDPQAKKIKSIVNKIAGIDARIWLFGSRAQDDIKGGDIDIFVSIPMEVSAPVRMSAKISVQLMRLFSGRKVDVIIEAPNLPSLPIFKVAKSTGIEL